MKKFYSSILFFFIVLANTANAAFVGTYDVSNWTQIIDGGSIDTGGAPNSVALTSSNDGSLLSKSQDFIIVAAADGVVSFNWSYKSYDEDGGNWDPFGWLLNGNFERLTGGAIDQTGFFSAVVSKNDVFGFRANSLDSSFGAAVSTVSNFSVTVPTPATLWMIGLGLLGLWRIGRTAHQI